jgi:pimeloyl-ACP methyl ester carboxylesterase
MKKQYLFLLFAFHFLAVSAYAQPYQIGHKQQTFVDAARSNRSIATEIYYPAATASDNVSISSGQFPVVVFGHGFVMTWDAYNVVWQALVPSGYILVFPKTEGSISPSHDNFGQDLAFLVGAMKSEGANASSTFSGAVAATSAVMGHSMGGGAAFLAVQYDSTITAIATLAAAETSPSAIAAAVNIRIPALVLSAGNDCVTPPADHQIPMYDSLASDCKTFVSITGGSHCRFAGTSFTCSFGEGTCSPSPTITAATQQTITAELLLPWLDFYLKSDCAGASQFQDLIAAGAGITSQQNCGLVCVGLQENNRDNQQYNIFPNPFERATTIRFSQNLTDASLIIYDSFGRNIVQKNNIYGQELILERENLASGVYFVQLIERGQIIVADKIRVQ